MESASFANIRSAIKRAMKAQGKTHRDLANALGMSESGIKKSLTGDDCSLSKLSAVCRVLELKLSESIRQAASAESARIFPLPTARPKPACPAR